MTDDDTQYDDIFDFSAPDAVKPGDEPVLPAFQTEKRGQEAKQRTPVPTHNQPPRKRTGKVWYTIVGGSIITVLLLSGTLLSHMSLLPLPTTGTSISHRDESFRYTACPFMAGEGIVEGQTVRCGFLTVPEDRAQPGGKSVRLAVAIYKPPHASALGTPTLYLNGGPGGALLNRLAPSITAANIDSLTQGHELILLDQRGTGYSQPSLDCYEVTAMQRATAGSALSRDQQNAYEQRATRACYTRLIKTGVDLKAYTTIANATDVHDLIRALGYKQVNLYGVSYGTRLALTVMRLFPDDVRSVILDSTVPTQENLYDVLPTVTQHAFDTLFQGCAASRRCATSYPELQSLFYHLVDALNAHPAMLYDAHYGPIALDGDDLANWVFSSLYVTRLIPLLPEAIVQISQGNYSIISKYYAPLMLDANISYGMYYSVECGEDMAFTTSEKLDQATSVLRPEVKPDIQESLQSDFSICQFWKQTPVPAAQKLPVTSSIPTLILAGGYDPITPSSNGKLAMQGLSRSYFFLFPGTGHGVFRTGACPNSIVAAFLLNPGTKPTASCVADVAEPDFAVAS